MPKKGFGFVEMTEGGGDVFLHASVLARTGVTAVSPGATLKVRTGQGQKGPQVTEVTEVDESTAGAAPAPRAPRPPSGGGYGDRPGLWRSPRLWRASGLWRWCRRRRLCRAAPQLRSVRPGRSRTAGHGEMVQHRQGLRLHRARGWRQGRVRPRLRLAPRRPDRTRRGQRVTIQITRDRRVPRPHRSGCHDHAQGPDHLHKAPLTCKALG